jgi:sucrose-6-phosphate hydrolase SacC (GH32 family)
MGTTCAENDPNGPLWDPVHKVYHLFYQDHVSQARNGSDGKPMTGTHGPDWGHAVSKDFVHWTHLREAIWNGPQWYDLHAIYTGSATIVNGSPVIICEPFFLSTW